MSDAPARRLVFAVPGDLDTPTGGYAYDRRVIAELRAAGRGVEVMNLGEGFPRPEAATRAAAIASLEAIAPETPTIVDGLAFGVLPELAATVCRRVPVVALVHHPLALESGIGADEARQLRESERSALAGARGVIVTSPATARLVAADYGVAPERITVAVPGVERPAPRPTDVRRGGPVALLAVGALVPRKGYDVLVSALSRLADLDWRLTIVGPPDRDPATAAAIAAQIAAEGLGDRVTIAGAVPADTLAALYGAADVFVLASRFEGYGMAFSEAASYGLPVVGTTGGAIPDTVPAGAGLLVAPDDVAALAAALHRVIGDAAVRARLAAAARAAAEGLPTWAETARIVAATIDRIRTGT
ncbi:glycosyltransferase family 4 protein [Rhodoplanes sp. TEM]|uniref:Glycosyltransferase family 4 protein n=1 Tax=Rhodoplanes tepidamans TaxID=200616 RepID=A0ABT5J7W0_RHOTP|nr:MULTISPECIES: glycosyltransferase family 4 protein [Rhodoplanes]MDC7785739.1 glycosyltransferase family 4 protein [Rhodoplanes tepidamans]MDC7986295.1 glycosyltransferase family 4 protein [Rhodoplanes sp. TEM]MDQ0354699.1 glycosyltransferase involved in cell wall biosynthesis [Rhodoplanes tepidamans]